MGELGYDKELRTIRCEGKMFEIRGETKLVMSVLEELKASGFIMGYERIETAGRFAFAKHGIEEHNV